MSYTSIPNQPILFNTVLPENCVGCEGNYSQLVDFNDQLFWQLETEPCGALELKLSALSNWTQSGSEITATGNAGYLLQQYWRFDVITVVKVVISVTNYNSGTLVVSLAGGSFEYLTTVGTHTLYLNIGNLTSPYLTLDIYGLAGNLFNGTFIVESVEPIATGALFTGIVDAQTLAVVQVLDPVLTVKDQYLTAAIDLADYELTAGCYRLAIADYCTNTCGQYFIYNPFFSGDPLCIGCEPIGWSNNIISGGANWDAGNGSASITMTTGDVTQLVSVTELCEDVEYSVTIKVETMLNARLRFQVDNVTYETINIAGIYTFDVTPTSSGAIALQASQFSSIPSEIEVSYVKVRAYKEHAVYDKYSEVISIGDYSDECRFFKLEGCNAENQFGLAFSGTSFLPGIRLEGRQFRAQYNSDVDLFRYASGRAVTSYADIRKRWSFYFGRLPEYVFDFLSIITYFDNLYVNGELYAPAEDSFPEIEYNDADNLGAITIDLFKKNVKVRKTVCSAADANCLPSILDLGGEPFLLTQAEDRILTQDNVNLYQE